MNAEVQNRFDTLESRREALTAKFLAMSPDQQQAHVGAWSMSYAEKLEGLLEWEQFLAKPLSKTPPGKLAGKKPLEADKVARMADGLRRNASAQQERMSQRRNYDPHQLISNWQTVRESLKSSFDQVSDPEVGFLQPVIFGPIFSASAVLSLLEADMDSIEAGFSGQSGVTMIS